MQKKDNQPVKKSSPESVVLLYFPTPYSSILYFCFSVVADVLSEFLEVAVHLILYVREVYPIGIFQKRKKYNVPVQVRDSPGS